MAIELLKSPWTALGAFLSAVGGLLGAFDPFLQLIVSTSGIWFTIVSVGAGVIAPAVEWIPTDLATQVFLLAALVYVLIYVSKFVKRARESL